MHLDRMIYIDDSGHPASGQIVYGWIEFRPDRWASVLSAWLEARKMLWREFGIPVTTELHATEYVNGRGRISTRLPSQHVHGEVEYWKDFGRDVARTCLDTLRCAEGLTIGSVWRPGTREAFAATKADTYTALVARFEEELSSTKSLGLVFIDGDPKEAVYRATHRTLLLNERHVVEDAIHLDSRSSQLIQMADLVAWTANVHVDRHPRNEFAWQWYDTYLAERDPRRSPQKI